MGKSTSTGAGDSEGMRHALDSKRILTDCCEQSASCRFQLVHSEFSFHATFVALHEEGIELRLSSEESGGPLHPEAICCVSFPYGTSFCAFLGCLVEVRAQDVGETTVIATTPGQLTVTNLRESFRVPVVAEAGLATALWTPTNQKFIVTACDITEAGMEVEFGADAKHGLAVGAPVTIELNFRGEIVKRSAEVRRLVRSRCGLSFNRPSDVAGRRQVVTMRGIVLSLQQLWLKSRLT